MWGSYRRLYAYPMIEDPAAEVRADKDGTSWRVGSQAEVEWINGQTEVGMTITSGIPPVFGAYATIVVPEDVGERQLRDRAILAILVDHTADQRWWLGYLDDGTSDTIFVDAPQVGISPGARYVLVEAGPIQAATWRTESSWRGALPELMFPADHSWLLNTLIDDDWSCFGGPSHLVKRLVADAMLETLTVGLVEDATPPGHTAI